MAGEKKNGEKGPPEIYKGFPGDFSYILICIYVRWDSTKQMEGKNNYLKSINQTNPRVGTGFKI